MASAAKALRELRGRSCASWLRHSQAVLSPQPCDRHRSSILPPSPPHLVPANGIGSSLSSLSGAGISALLRRQEVRNPELVVGMARAALAQSPFLTCSRISTATSLTTAAPSAESEPKKLGKENKEKKTDGKSLGARFRVLLSDLEAVPISALGLGLAGAIPFVGLTPGIASLLPLPEGLSAMHMEAQAAYGAVILTFLGGPHWGLAMADNASLSTSNFSLQTVRMVRYVWSVVPSLVAWVALLLSPVPKLALLITSFGMVLSVDAIFAWMRLVPSWYMPLRVLLTSIAMLSLTSTLIVTAATNVVTQHG